MKASQKIHDQPGRKQAHTLKGTRLISIDALRGLAALAVTLFHGLDSFAIILTTQTPNLLFGVTALLFSFGYVGVYLFFVISGFCIHLKWAKDKAAGVDPKIDFIPFWKRRIRRLYPAYLVALFLYLGLSVYEQKLTLNAFAVYDVIVHLLMLHNLDIRTSYTINGVFWTLAIEEQLYLAYFLLLRLRIRLGWIKTLAICLTGRCLWFLGAAILHRAFNFDIPVTEAALSNWFVWALGAVSVEAFFGVIRLPGWCKNLLTGCTLFLLAILAAYGDRLTDPRGLLHELIWLANLPLWGLAFFVLVNCITRREAGWRAVNWPFSVPGPVRWFSLVGLFSYSLYLTHEIVLIYGGPFISHWSGISGNSLVVVRWLVLTPVCLGFAYLFYKWFEKPFLNPPSSIAPARTVLSEPSPRMTH